MDVYALGIVLYECLAQKRPTDAEGFGQVLKRITTAPLESLGAARPGLPRTLVRLVDRMLLRDREARPTLAEARAVLADVALSDDPAPSSENSPVSAAPTRTSEGVSTTAAPVANVSAAPPASPARRAYWLAPIALAVVGGVALAIPRKPVPPPPPVVASAAASAPRADAAGDAGASRDVDYRAMLDGGASIAQVFGPLAAQITQQIERHDGDACTRDLDLLDELSPSQPRSHDAKSPWAQLRAQCLMLAGECEVGKRLWGRVFDATASKGVTAAMRQGSIDGLVTQYCEGDNLSPHDGLLRVRAKLGEAVSGLKKATPSECLAWHEKEEALSRAQPASDDDARRRLSRTNVTLCLARAGDCPRASQVFRDLWRPTEGDRDAMRDILNAVVTPLGCPAER